MASARSSSYRCYSELALFFLLALLSEAESRPAILHETRKSSTSDKSWLRSASSLLDAPRTAQIIATSWALSAVHCVYDFNTGKPMLPSSALLIVGCNGNTRSSSCLEVPVTRYVLHPNFNPRTLENDVSVDLASLINNQLPRIDGLTSLPPGLLVPNNDILLAGYGVTANIQPNQSPQIPFALYKVSVPIATEQTCKNSNPTLSRQASQWVWLCVDGQGKKDSCEGDSGGPAFFYYNSTSFVVGVLSMGSEEPTSGPACATPGRYGVYTQIRFYTDFLASYGNFSNVTQTAIAVKSVGGSNVVSSSQRSSPSSSLAPFLSSIVILFYLCM
ncbi:hypothetical protein GUITHDRAFT_142097 [Guillardia theta CCMP2712]|uniref:Peptidase S1 domain-containing protein n=1 Tax=Guillardia theta (strain CCMP2712) TaxID=905079 RepID=L1J010_GUITC|nr:hypothetical protein GUITHDRAFT_142097 [Guillardia theta CCMP2712]EKX41415.1 hypothetical protein GUITHDRAFT_142097 [Guillardia theta CCMP2712]|eukprot:XP_005828395.1 hypothetical protein GUITHDRAFT_142097 [Guillardia theta CCMP2712]